VIYELTQELDGRLGRNFIFLRHVNIIDKDLGTILSEECFD
jgi:hypothetical protein